MVEAVVNQGSFEATTARIGSSLGPEIPAMNFGQVKYSVIALFSGFQNFEHYPTG